MPSYEETLKQQSLIRNLGSLIDQTSPSSDPCVLPKTNCISNYDLERCSSYIISQVDIEELDTRVVDVIQNSFIDLDNFENCVPTKKRSMADYPCFVHPWGLQKVNNMPDVSDGDYIDLLNIIGRHFEEVLKVEKKTPGSKGSQTVSEKSLSWKELCHRSSKNRGQETDGSVSEIIPSILVGSEKDLVISSPQIISSWEKLFLSPYDQSKDVLYFAIVPDDNIMVDKAKLFFDEVSRTYEGWRLGKHAKITKDFVKDGIIRVPTNVNIKPNCNSRAFQAFFDKLDRENEDEVLVKKLKAYASFCELQLATFFKNNDSLFERKAYCEILYRENSQSIKNDDTSQMDLMATTNSNVSNTDNFSRSSFNNSVNDTSVGETATVADHLIPEDEFPVLPHIIVIYLINPFNFDVNNRTSKATRLANISLMRAFNLFISQLAESRRCSIQLELINLSSIMDLTGLFFDVYREGRLMFDEAMLSRNKSDNGMAFELIKSIVISVYTHTRIIQPSVVSNYIPKSMTRFGPSSDIQDILKDIAAQKPMYLKVSCSLATLAPTTAFGINVENTFLNPAPEEKILHVSYCLIQDKWLVGAVTDDQGLLLDNTVINLETPKERNKMPKYFAGSQILDALTRFWQYIMGVLAMEVKNWRLIIGRVGKVGHGEFKTWMLLLSKNNIKRYNTRLKEACNTCNSSTTFHETPAIASACFISLEAEPYLRVFLTPSTIPINPETKEPIANKYSSKTHMPLDISSTHITVFPTSAEIIVDNHQDNDDHGIEDLSDLVFEDDIGTLVETLGLDATTEENNLTSSYIKQSENIFFNLNISDISISSQPLAAGFIISAAPANDLPNWFWAQCPTRKNKSPVHLRSSLHINTNNIFQSDDDYSNTAVLENQHPLDSSKTDDVLRYVLESYNQLSWLNVDIITGEKKSCLPLHIQALLRLYNTIEKLIL
uniref:Mediator of RNA polymerase II transcription subunit 13 n=1 Tax=Rhabditophanes sp. KR3021 TaxID=114890 RepID=A0AC35TFX8_9BILA